MGVFKRLSDLLKANVNDLIDRAENPEKMVKQIICQGRGMQAFLNLRIVLCFLLIMKNGLDTSI